MGYQCLLDIQTQIAHLMFKGKTEAIWKSTATQDFLRVPED